MRRTIARWLLVGALAGCGVLAWNAVAYAQEEEAPNIVHEGDNSGDIRQGGDAQAADTSAGSQITGIVSEAGTSTSVQASNTSSDSTAESGNVRVTNRVDRVEVGPRAAPRVSVAQDGDNEAEVDQQATVASGDAVAGSQVTGIVAADAAVIDVVLESVSEDAEAVSGEATADNFLEELQVGPVTEIAEDEDGLGQLGAGEDADSNAGPFPVTPLGVAVLPGQVGAAQIVPGSAPLTQLGDNEAEVSQDGTAASGDAVAGSQVTGLVAFELGAISLNNRQSSDAPTAVTGNATTSNTLGEVASGPELELEDPAVEDATVFQEGDNELEAGQIATATTGDAVAGAQVTGVVGGGSVSVSLDGTSEDAEARSGEATATNEAATFEDIDLGDPFAPGLQGSLRAGPIAYVGNGGVATLEQTGDNSLELGQAGTAASGDAVAGGQVAGIVTTSADADVVVAATLSSDGDEATSGDASAENTAARAEVGEACLLAVCNVVAGSIAAGPILSVDGAGETATISQIGDNEVEVGQSGAATSGDAVAGGQVTGVVSAGDVTVLLDATSEDADAISGDATARNSAAEAEATCIAAVLALCNVQAGTITAGPVLYTGVIGPAPAESSIVQEGDNDLELGQSAMAASGDAVAGGQVTGVVASAGGDVTVSATLDATDAQSSSGNAVAENTAATARPGDAVPVPTTCVAVLLAACNATVGTLHAGPLVSSSGAAASVEQAGDNSLELAQSGAAASGDAVAGGQVTGIVAGGAVDVVLDAVSEDDAATSGEVTARNVAADAELTCVAVLLAICHAQVGTISAGPEVFQGAVFGEGSAAAVLHDGDNEVEVGQQAAATSGDAVAGGQVSGIVTSGGVVALAASLDSEGSESVSGDALSENVAARHTHEPVPTQFEEGGAPACVAVLVAACNVQAGTIHAGPRMYQGGASGDAEATAEQTGDNSLDLGQSAATASGDVVAGGQVTGVVGGTATVGIVLDATVEDAEATSGDATAANAAADARTGCVAVLIGICSQVAGVMQAGPEVHEGIAGFFFGQVSVEDRVTQIGHNELETVQGSSAVSGDGVAGAQVTGVVATAGTVAVDATLAAEDPQAETGAAVATNDAATVSATCVAVLIGICNQIAGALQAGPSTYQPLALVAAVDTVDQTGDNSLELDQSGTAASGDAVAGGQVTGVVASGGSTSVLLDASSEDDDARSGAAEAGNVAASGEVGCVAALVGLCDQQAGTVRSGPRTELFTAFAALDPATADIVQVGDNEVDLSQSASASTGDAVAGGQVTGVVASAGADVSMDATNASSDGRATSGNATTANEAALGDLIVAGPVGLDGFVAQVGDNEIDLSQSGSTGTGDAVAGSQVTGIVAAGTVDAVFANSADGDESVSGNATDLAVIGDFVVGPAVIGPFFA